MRYADRIAKQIQGLGNVPMPVAEAITHSEALYAAIVEQVQQKPMPFNQFMHQALYAPGLGYYSAGSHKIGAAGDFITAPELSPLFGASIANQVQQILALKPGSILEFGAGTGKLALSILRQLETLNCLPEKYLILEPSPDLQQRQQQLLEKEIPELYERCDWIAELPKTFNGVVIANEVLDAMPVHLFKTNKDSLLEAYVTLDDEGSLVVEFSDDIQTELQAWWQSFGQSLNLPEDYMSEVNLAMAPWLTSIASMLDEGLVLLIDYGFSQHEYYLEERYTGTLKCHYRHHHHDDPMLLLGLQDITAHVDFTAVAEAALNENMDVLGYVHQGGFLTSCGIVQMAEQQLSGDLKQQLTIAQEIKPLIMPEEMGEMFKMLTLGKGIEPTELGGLIGYQFMDLRQQL